MEKTKSVFFMRQREGSIGGQVILEYVLLLIVSVVMAQLLIQMVSLNPNEGAPFNAFQLYWKNLLQVVGADIST